MNRDLVKNIIIIILSISLITVYIVFVNAKKKPHVIKEGNTTIITTGKHYEYMPEELDKILAAMIDSEIFEELWLSEYEDKISYTLETTEYEDIRSLTNEDIVTVLSDFLVFIESDIEIDTTPYTKVLGRPYNLRSLLWYLENIEADWYLSVDTQYTSFPTYSLNIETGKNRKNSNGVIYKGIDEYFRGDTSKELFNNVMRYLDKKDIKLWEEVD